MSVDALPRDTWRRLIWPLAGLLLLAWALVHLWKLAVVVVLAVTVAGAILPVAEWAEARRIPRVVSVLVLYAILVGVVVGLGFALAPVLQDQAKEFWTQLPRYMETLEGWVTRLREWGESRQFNPQPPAPGQLGTILQGLLRRTLETTAGILGAILGGFLVFFLAAYFVVDARRIGEGLLVLVPRERRYRVAAMARPVLDRMGGYVRGQVAVAAGVSLFLSVGLALLGVRFGLLIGITAGALNLVPFIGSWIAAGLALLVAANQSLSLALWTAVLFWIEQIVEGKVLIPFLLGRQVNLHPIAVLLALLAGAQIAGLVGALVAIPLVAGAAEALRQLAKENSTDPGASPS